MGFIWLFPWIKLVSNNPRECLKISRRELNYIIENTDKSPSIQEVSPFKLPWLKILTSKSVWAIILTNVLSDFTLYGILSVFPTFFHDIYDIDILTLSYITTAEYLFMFMSTIFAGFFSDFIIESKRLSTLTTRKVCNSFGMILPAILFSIIGFFDCRLSIVAVVLFVFAGGFSGTYFSSGYMLNSVDIAGSYSGLIISLSNSLGSISGILAPYIANLLTINRTIFEWRLCFIIFSSILVCAALVFIFLSNNNLELWAMTNSNCNNVTIFRKSNSVAPIAEPKRNSMTSDDVLVISDSYEEINKNFDNTVLVQTANNWNSKSDIVSI